MPAPLNAMARFDQNIVRVYNLVLLYMELDEAHRGRRSASAGDVLRAAAVLLHATLEDFLRSIALERWPSAGSQVLDSIALVGSSPSGRPEKFFLGALAAHRKKSVGAVVKESIEAHLGRLTFNNIADIANHVVSLGADVDKVKKTFPRLGELMKRRHHIVHQGDRNERRGSGHHTFRSISRTDLDQWALAVVEFTNLLDKALP